MPARPKWSLCGCALCPHEGKFFRADEIVGHKASVSATQRHSEGVTQPFDRQLRETVSNPVILQSVERLIVDHPNSSSSIAAAYNADHPSTSRADGFFHASAAHSIEGQSPAELLGLITASLHRVSCRLHALERSIAVWSPAKSRALLSEEEEVIRLHLKASRATRSATFIPKARGDIQLLCESIEARILETKALVAHMGSKLRVVDCESYFSWSIDGSDEIMQSVIFVGLSCSVILSLSRRATSLIIGLVRIVSRSALVVRAGRRDIVSELTMDRIPTDPRTILSRCNLTGRTTIYAACPKCHFTYKPSYVHGSVLPIYPTTCTNRRHPDSAVCATRLTRERIGKEGVIQTPIKPFVYHSVLDFVGALFSHSGLEERVDRACDVALEEVRKIDPQEVRDVDDIFQGGFLRTLRSLRSGRLFIDRRGEGRLAFSLNIDFFNVNGNRAGGAVTSCGIITLACLNLSPRMRYKFENLHVAGIVPGPREPDLDSINGFLKPLMDEMVELWEPGVKLSRTAWCERGREVRGVLVCVVCDLPAARKVAALANHRIGNFLCSLYKKTRANIGNMADGPQRRCSPEMRASAEAWARAPTYAQQEAIFQSAGVRFSELWRLCYWEPTRQLAVDLMHNLLLGVAQDHFRNVLSLTSITSMGASTVSKARPAFCFEFTPVPAKDSNSNHPIHTPGSKDYMDDKDIMDVSKIHERLLLPLATTERTCTTSREAFAGHLAKKHRYRALEFVCNSLDISPQRPGGPGENPRLRKADWASALASWHFRMPHGSDTNCAVPPMASVGLLQHIRTVIQETCTPSWTGSVPSNVGDAKAGKPKADEWRLLFTIYLPLALVSKWGEGSDHPDSTVACRSRQFLDHTMRLVSAVTLACARTTSYQMAQRYEDHIREYLRTMRELHPDVGVTMNMHMATHIPEFMNLFGPAFSWWCFPFERLIGFMQRMPNNGKIGQLEASIHERFIAFSRVKLWSSRPDCPGVIREWSEDGEEGDSEDASGVRRPVKKVALPVHLQGLLSVSSTVRYSRHLHRSVLYSTTTCHVGNSLVLVRPGGTPLREGAPGVVEDICLNEHDEIIYVVHLYSMLRGHRKDPFRFYRDFPARAYSPNLSARPCVIRPRWVVSHFARYQIRSDVIAVLPLSKNYQ